MKVYNYKYQTKQWLPQHDYNLYDFGARMYACPDSNVGNPVLARFTTPDPLMQFNNPYLAMGANPVSMIDPSGMWSSTMINHNMVTAQEMEHAAAVASQSGRGTVGPGSAGVHFYTQAGHVIAQTQMQHGTENTATFYQGYYNGASTGISASYNNALENNYQAYRDEWFSKNSGSALNRDLWKNNITGEFIEMPAGMALGQNSSILSRGEFAKSEGGAPPSYTPPPKDGFPGFPDIEKMKPKGGRPRWRLPDDDIIEWDGQHRELERYNPRGKHKGVWNPEGEQIKDPVPGRKIDPILSPWYVPSQNTIRKVIIGGTITVGVGIILFDIFTIPSGEGLIGVQMIRMALIR
ncbi:MAG: hypothetical protein IPO27_09595 [Bacteroidetes bacterium]|nr:hypothetical protein [Bacteroidota bacterium]